MNSCINSKYCIIAVGSVRHCLLKMSISERFALIILVLLVFDEGLLLTVMSCSSYTPNKDNKDDAKQNHRSQPSNDQLLDDDSEIPEDCSKCGIGEIYSHPHVMIRGGRQLLDTGSFPWMISLCSFGINSCAGAILNEYFILTAAHCVTDDFLEVVTFEKVCFQTGKPEIMSDPFEVEKIIVHPKFNLILSKTTYITFAQYDVALLKLKEKIKCNSHRNPICLPDANFNLPIGQRSLILGWGTSNPLMETQTEILHFGSIKHLPFEECIKAVPETTIVENHTLCEGGTRSTVCYGDSGGPLAHRIGDKYYVVGIASSETNRTCPATSPVMYTNVMEFVDWIKNEMEKYFSSKE